MTLAHGGILLVILGSICLAYAIKIENKYTLSARSRDEERNLKNIVQRAEDGSYYEPNIVHINKMFFRFGLGCVAIGSLMQW